MTTKTTTNAKKSTPKKETRSSKTKRSLVCAQGEQCFWTTDGKIIANLVELRDTLAGMTDEVFSYHVNSERNDFSNWIADVLDDRDLAQSIKTARKPRTAQLVVVRRLKEYHV